MAELTDAMVRGRLETVASGSFSPEIPGLPGIVFHKMTLADRGVSSRAYSSKLKELMAAGGYFNEALLPTVLERACKENGLDIVVLKKQREILKRFFDSIPADLQGPFDELTDEEVSLLSNEEKEAREKAIEERGRRIMEFAQSFYTDEDYRVMEQAKQIEALEQHLRANTAEHNARKHQMETEILLCAKDMDGKPYFSSLDEIHALEDTNREALVQLYTKWRQFREGYLPKFFRSDHTA